MEKLKNVASYICTKYEKEFGHSIDEMKLHKLLYFTQRESFIQNNEPLFDNTFYGWKYGPVLKEVRGHYKEYLVLSGVLKEKNSFSIVDKVFQNYASKDSWSLSLLTHGEISWKRARVGLSDGENGDNPMKNTDIVLDAARIKERRKMRQELGIN